MLHTCGIQLGITSVVRIDLGVTGIHGGTLAHFVNTHDLVRVGLFIYRRLAATRFLTAHRGREQVVTHAVAATDHPEIGVITVGICSAAADQSLVKLVLTEHREVVQRVLAADLVGLIITIRSVGKVVAEDQDAAILA